MIEVNSRVSNELLGKGTVVSTHYISLGMIEVMWDKTPPMDYNCGSNPTVVFIQNIEILEEEKYVLRE